MSSSSSSGARLSIWSPQNDTVHLPKDQPTRRSTLNPLALRSLSGNTQLTKAVVAPTKDAALEVLAHKIREMEIKLDDQTVLMNQLREENAALSSALQHKATISPVGSLRGAKPATEFNFFRECQTQPVTPQDTAVTVAMGVLGDSDTAYQPQLETVARILSQSFSYSLVLPQDFRALTWTIAHRTQRSAAEGHALKFAVNFLISKVHQLRGQPMEAVVREAILAELFPLAQTANGNYLVQQLVECGGAEARLEVYEVIRSDVLQLSNDKYGTHVVCKLAEFTDVREIMIPDLVKIGVADTFQTGARRLWKAIFESSKKAGEFEVFDIVIRDMNGKWAEVATGTENGTISVQQVFETWPSIEYWKPVLYEIMVNIARIANGGWGHFLISKLLSNPSVGLRTMILTALLESPQAVAVGHHGISFLRTALLELGRPGIESYCNNICSVKQEGHAPHIVEIAGAVVGPGHISFLWAMLNANEKNALKEACRSHIVSIRGSQSGNDLLRQLGLMQSHISPKLR